MDVLDGRGANERRARPQQGLFPQRAADPPGSTGHGGALVGPEGGSPAALTALASAMDFAAAALAPATLRAYRADWSHFLAWCRAAGLACARPHNYVKDAAAYAVTAPPATVPV